MLTIGFGGMLGAISRYLLSDWIKRKANEAFPLATLLINLLGSFLLGMLMMGHIKELYSDMYVQFLGIGFLGAFTTFSTFCVELVDLLEKKEYKRLYSYLLLSVGLGIFFAFLGSLLIAHIS